MRKEAAVTSKKWRFPKTLFLLQKYTFEMGSAINKYQTTMLSNHGQYNLFSLGYLLFMKHFVTAHYISEKIETGFLDFSTTYL